MGSSNTLENRTPCHKLHMLYTPSVERKRSRTYVLTAYD